VKILASLLALVPLYPRILGVVEACQCILHYLKALAALADTNNLAGLYAVRGDADHLTVYNDVLVVDKLTCSTAGRCNAQTVNNVVKTALEVLKENLTGNTTGTGCLVEHVTELLLQHTIGVLCLLLLSKQDTVLGSLATSVVTVLAGREIALCQYFVCTKDSLAKTTGNS